MKYQPHTIVKMEYVIYYYIRVSKSIDYNVQN